MLGIKVKILAKIPVSLHWPQHHPSGLEVKILTLSGLEANILASPSLKVSVSAMKPIHLSATQMLILLL